MFKVKRRSKIAIFSLVIIGVGMLVPQNFSMPVEGASKLDYNQESFWYFPWGRFGTHKGVDIFAEKGTTLNSSVSGLVLYKGNVELGGNVTVILGPKWRLHYFAHLENVTTSIGWINRNAQLGTVGNSGNAAGKPAHLHYSIVTLVPYFWQIDNGPQGWKKMFYINPIPYLNEVK